MPNYFGSIAVICAAMYNNSCYPRGNKPREDVTRLARERYLVGVSEEELRPDPKPDGPKTPKGKLENIWYHYKWAILGCTFAAIVLTVLIVQTATREKYDYDIIMATEAYVLPEQADRLKAELLKYAVDLNGDGEVKINLQTLCMTGEMQMVSASQQRLIASLASADSMFYILDKSIYDRHFGEEAETASAAMKIFADTELTAEGVSPEWHYWNWKGSPLQSEELFSTLSDDIYFGVREAEGMASKRTAMRDQCMTLLRGLITGEPQQTGKSGQK